MKKRLSNKRRHRRSVAIIFAMLAITGLLAACDESVPTTSSMCAFIAGDGVDGHDAKLHNVVYPNQNVDYNYETEVVTYVPCNSRNYIINDGSVENANGDRVGDRSTPTLVYTQTGVPIEVWTTSYWTLNQDREAMEDFYNFCFKYTCASSENASGNANFATKGWNGMVGENFGTSIDRVALAAAGQIEDAIWQNHNPDLYKQLGETMSATFADQVRAVTGYNTDLFCGSGNSGWKDPDNPGDGEFTCTAVRIVVDRVNRADVNVSSNSQAAQVLNETRYNTAEALYGDQTRYWLGLQDTIAACKASKSTCVIHVGSAGNSTTNTAVPLGNN